MSESSVCRWVQRFKDGDSSVHDKDRPGAVKKVTSKKVAEVRAIVQEDGRISIPTISGLGLSVGLVHFILRTELHMRKRSARWVPHMLTTAQEQTRVDMCEKLLCMYHRGGLRFISRIVTGDETWACCYEPETKAQSRQWIPTNSRSPPQVQKGKSPLARYSTMSSGTVRGFYYYTRYLVERPSTLTITQPSSEPNCGMPYKRPNPVQLLLMFSSSMTMHRLTAPDRPKRRCLH